MTRIFQFIALLCVCAWSVNAASYYVSTTGNATNSGAIGSPWSIAHGIDNATIAPGDTLYLRGGTYAGGLTSRLAGTAGNKITVRPHGSERPIIESTGATVGIDVYGSNTLYYGIEVWNSTTPRAAGRGAGVMIWGPGTRWANGVVHDVGVGIGVWDDATPSEVYGNVVYNCGNSAQEHGIYAHGTALGNTIRDNITLNNYGFGVHVYAETAGSLAKVDVIGNISACNGSLAAPSYQPNYLIGGTVPSGTMSVLQNCGYYSAGYQDNLQLGYLTTENGSATVTSNYFGHGTTTVNHWTNLVMTANSWSGVTTYWNYNPTAHIGTYSWDTNSFIGGTHFVISGAPDITFAAWQAATGFDAHSSYTGTAPSSTVYFVRPNAYETGRGNVSVYNWSAADNVSVDLSSVCASGTTYTVRNAANYYGPTVKTFTYAGSPVSLPMTNLTVATPVGASAPSATGPAFNAFVVEKSLITPPVTKTRGFLRKRP